MYFEEDGMEINPMPVFLRLSVSDIVESQEFYHKLGFIIIYEMQDNDGSALFAHIRKLKYQDILLAGSFGREMRKAETAGMGINYPLDKYIFNYAKKAESAAAALIEVSVKRLRNAYELIIEDPDGYRLNFSDIL